MLRSLRPALRDAAAAALAGAGITRPARWARGRLSIATFHRVLPESCRRAYPLPGLVVTPEELGWFLDTFLRHFRCGSLADCLGWWQQDTAEPLLAITFDDGQADNFEHARPVLEERGLRASFYVPVDAVERSQPLWHDRLGFAARALEGRAHSEREELLGAGPSEPGALMARAKALDPEAREAFIRRVEDDAGSALPAWAGMMSWSQLRELAEAGHEIGSHSLSHALLPQLEEEALEREVAGSRERLQQALGVPVSTFCYPNGDHDARVAESVRRAGYTAAVTTTWGTNARGAPPFTLKRCDMNADNTRSRGGVLSASRLAWRMSGLHPGLG